MSNIDKQANSVSRIIADLKLKHGSGDTYAPIMRWDELLALLDELEALQSFRTAYMEWSDKTGWVQTDKRFDVIKPWGKHRADVLKLYIDHLESKLEVADKLQDSAFRSGLQQGFSFGQMDDQNGFAQCMAAYSRPASDAKGE